MAKFNVYEQGIYNYYYDLVKFNELSRDKVDANTKYALNLGIILCSACLIEGVLEDRGKLLLGYYREIYNAIEKPIFELRKPLNHFYNNVELYLSKKISQCTGLDNYNSLYELFTGSSLKQDTMVKPLIEGVNVLFQFRNVIAHGRQVHGYDVETYYIDGIEENFFGGYKKTEEYLLKKGLINEKFKNTEDVSIYFTDEVADHFSLIAKDFIKALDCFVLSNISSNEIIETRMRKYNENYSTTYDMISYLRMRGAR